MSRVRPGFQSRKFLWISAITAGFSVSSASWGGTLLEEAQAQRSKAFNDFYLAYKSSSRVADDVSGISQRTIEPASLATAWALSRENIQALKQSGITVMSQAEADAQRERMLRSDSHQESEPAVGPPGAPALAAKSPSGSARDPSAAAQKPAFERIRAGAPAVWGGEAREAVIDGSRIPSEITFEPPIDPDPAWR